MYPPQTKPLFYSAALFNWGAVLILALLAQPLALPPPQDSLFAQNTLAAIFVFGCGYWMVGQSPKANRGIAALGAFAKLAIVALVFGHWLAGSATTQMAALVSGDIVYAILFIWYLRRTTV